MAPGLTWENTGGDGGDFLAAAFTWGVPHPTGYPTYIVLLRAFGEVLPIGSEAFRGNLFSAVTAAIAVPVFFGATWHTMRLVVRHSSKLTVAVCAFAAASLATANLFWSQATITEVYALNALFAAGLLWLTAEALSGIRRGERKSWTVVAAAFLLGLALGNHVTIGLFVAPLVVLAVYGLYEKWGWRSVLDWRPLVALVLGLGIYSYAPIASAQDPALNWFQPHTWDGFWAMATGSLYQDYLFNVRPGFVPSRILAALDLWLTQYSLPGAVLGIAGLSLAWERSHRLAGATLIAALLLLIYAITYNSFDPYVYLIPAFMVFAVWMAIGLESLAYSATGRIDKLAWIPGVVRRNPVAAILLAALLLVPVWSVAFNYWHVDISDDREAIRYVEESFETAGPGSVIFAEDIRAFGLWYQEMVAEPGAGVAVIAVHLLPYDYYWDQLHRRFPELMPSDDPGLWSDRVAAIVDHNTRDRAVYFTDQGPYNENWELIEAGPLLAVAPIR